MKSTVLKNGNYEKARLVLNHHATSTMGFLSITVLRMALVEVSTKCTTLIKESRSINIIVPKLKYFL